MAKSNSTKYRKMSPTFIAKTQEWLDNFLSYKFATCIISNDVRTCAYNVCHSYCQRDWPGLKLNFGFHKKKTIPSWWSNTFNVSGDCFQSFLFIYHYFQPAQITKLWETLMLEVYLLIKTRSDKTDYLNWR